MRGAVEGRGDSDLKLLAVTALTSYDDSDLRDAGYGFAVRDLVRMRAEQARTTGIDGIVCSAAEAEIVRDVVGRDMAIDAIHKEVAEGDMGGEIFPDLLSLEEAEALAREGVVRYILRKRGPKPTVNDIEEHFHFHAPVWVYYFRAAGGKIDLAVLDAYSGDRMGGLMRRAIVEGFIAKRRATAGAETS